MNQLIRKVAAAIFIASIATAHADLNSGLIAYYPFDGNANDASGHGNNGTRYGTHITSDRFGNASRALQFEWGDYVRVPRSSLLEPITALTVALWVQPDVVSLGYPYQICILTKRLDTHLAYEYGWNSYYFGLATDGVYGLVDGAPFFAVALSSGRHFTAAQNIALSMNAWTHLVGTYDGTAVKLFVNGTLVSSTSATGNVVYNSSLDLFIGWSSVHLGLQNYAGKIDDVRIYNRALSASEVLELYMLGGGSRPTVANVRAAQRSGTKLVDIWYDVINPSGRQLGVTMSVSTNNGTSFNLPAPSVSGDVGALVTPGSNRKITWDAGKDWPNKWSSQVKFRITASAAITADSAATTVDTRDGDRPVVQDVFSEYCSGTRHAYFLNGVSLNQTFTVNVNWNGKVPGVIKFIGPWGTHTQPGTQATRTYNVGTAFGVGGTLTVVLVASDGTESLPYRVNFDVINPPPGIPSGLLYVKPLAGTLTYATPQYSFNVLDSNLATVETNVPIFGGEKLGFVAAARASAEVAADGTASAQISADTGCKLPMAGFDVIPRLTGRPKWTYSAQVRQWIPAGNVGIEASASMSTPPAYVWLKPNAVRKFLVHGIKGVGSAAGLRPKRGVAGAASRSPAGAPPADNCARAVWASHTGPSVRRSV